MSEGELTIDGYQLTGCVATGNASEIWEVSNTAGGSQPLCMKLLLPHALQDSDAKAVLKHEAKVGKSLDHPNIVKVHKIAVTKAHGYMLMDFFRAPNIKQQIQSDPSGLQSRLKKVMESLCLALGYMHEKGWVHKDIKPENILSNKAGELRLIDFSLSVRAAGGLGKFLGGRSKAVQGTRTYIAPETLLKKSPTIQTDMYSLGITVFEILTGSPPFRGMSPGELLRMHVQEKAPPASSANPNVTQEMDRLVARLLEKKPDKRHKTMEEVYAEFRAIKVFKEDPLELNTQRVAARKQADLDGLGASDRINSRRDHLRSESGLTPAPKPQQPKPAAETPPQTDPRQQPQPAQRQPAQGQGYGPGAPYPNYPGPPPGYGYPPGYQPPPGYGMPQPPPGYAPGQMPPGYGPNPNQPAPQQQPPQHQQPQHQQPQHQPPQHQPPQHQPPQHQPPQHQPPQQQPPQQQPPQQQPPQQQPPQQQPAQQQPAQKKPEAEKSPEPQKKREHPETQSRKEDENLPLMEMDDLPDVL